MVKRIPAEIFSRVVGYFRPVTNWNKGKQQEKSERKEYLKDEIKEAIIKHDGN